MAKTKKVILFIVEGITDQTALGNVLTSLLNSDTVRFAMTDGDITTNKDVNPGNVVNRVNAIVKNALQKYAFKPSDLSSIVHLIDTDGAFIPDAAVVENPDAPRIEYTEDAIQTPHLDSILKRNAQKKGLVGILRGKSEISKKPYRMFYFSRNMEHALHDESRELTSDEKMALAEQFDDSYADRPQDFVEYLRSGGFAAPGDYDCSWKFINEGTHSLERWSNFHVFFEK